MYLYLEVEVHLRRRRILEELLPSFEQRRQVVPGRSVCGDEVDVRPVPGKLLLELRDALLGPADLSLDDLDRRRFGPSFRPGTLLASLHGLCLLHFRLAATQVLGPAAAIGDEPARIDREQPPEDRVEQRAVVGDQ